MNDLEREIDQLLGWYGIKRKYVSGLCLTVAGIFVFIVKLILLYSLLPNYIAYDHGVLIYNGTMIRFYVGIIMGCIGGLLLLIGLPLLIINTKKKKKL
ncbi:MAG: hypothetical protein KGD58_08050 [Candidatus Lokiarchaeota archaeon]|nr:hypothetical protein [Candidatus Lokiarchaeota archaeon]